MEDVLLKTEGEYTVPYYDNKASVYQEGPYGFWFIKLERGMTPKEFKGSFTSPDAAITLIKSHEKAKKALKG